MNKIKELFDNASASSVLLKTSEQIRDENFYYFTGLEKSQNLGAILILRKNKKPLLLANVLKYGTLRNNKNFRALRYESRKELEKIIRKHTSRKIGINYPRTTIVLMRNMKRILKGKNFVDVSGALAAVRETKTADEIKKIKEACSITSEIMRTVPDMAKPGMCEKELETKIGDMVRRHDVDFSFPPIVASGANSSVPHHVTGSKKLRRGEVLLVDIGVVFSNYCSDITRTFFIGRAPEKIRTTYGIVKKAQDAAFSVTKEGAKSKDVFRKANDILKKELGQSLVHALGHGIGIDVHDFPEGISDKSKYKLKENMTLAIEPAYYGPRFGIRIEDNLVVGKHRCGILTKSPKDIVEI